MLAETVDIRRWLREDRDTPYRERLERDRAIGRELAAGDDLARVLGWWRSIRASSPEPPALGARVEAARRLGSAALVMFGLLLGGLVAGVAFAYDGRSPVNLFALLGVLVGLPLLLLAFTLLLIPGRVPGLAAVQSIAAGMNLGRWIGAWMDRLLGAELFAPQFLGSGSASRFSRWQLVVFSQWLALGFFVGALTVALLRVTFTDLAFGWGTTLRMEPSTVLAWVDAVATPWAPWLPQAVPDAALVEASRIHRLEEVRLPPERVQLLGRWWPFVLMTMLVYGALPRLLLMLIGAWRLRRASRALLLDDPEVTALCDRLDAPLVAQLGSADEEQLEADRDGLTGPREPVAAEGLVLMIWNQAVPSARARAWLVEAMGVEPAALAELGILQSEDQQRAILAAVRQQVKPAVRRVLVVTKGWEPPLLEFMDFLGLVRETLSGEASVTVVPLALDGDRVHDEEREVWARALARLRDPRLYVMEAAG